jgi:hypothetical protein
MNGSPERQGHFRTLAVAWTLLILAACSIPGHELPASSLLQYDKLAHFALFAVLGGLWMHALPGPLPRTTRVVTAAGLAYAALTEVYQSLLPLGRSGDPLDVLADAAGLLTAVVLYRWWAARREAA